MKEKTRGGAPYVINIAGGNRKLEIIFTTIHSRKGTWNDQTNSSVKPLYLKKYTSQTFSSQYKREIIS